MSRPSSLTYDLPLGVRVEEVMTSLVAWGIYLLGTTCYCILHQAIVTASSPDLEKTVTLALREWGIWLVTTPAAFRALRQYEAPRNRPLTTLLQLGAVILLVSVACPVVIDHVTQTRSVASSVVIFLPRYLAALTVVYLIWHVFLRNSLVVSGEAREGAQDKHCEYPETLLVSKGAEECLIRVDGIECVSAAGNYVEICSGRQTYLMRATMKQIEALLPPQQFIRVHRSHIVNLDEIDRIKNQPSGNGAVYLRSGRTLSMSKSYRAHLHSVRKQAERWSATSRLHDRETPPP